MKKEKEIKKAVKKGYGEIAKKKGSCCGSSQSCCGSTDMAEDISKKIGYSEEEIKAAPGGANLGLGCGNPVALASLKEGDIVLDLGSGAGFDCFLISSKVGEKGRVIGIDMTPEMVKKARENAKKGNYRNVEFRLGEIEKLPVDDNSIDVVMSNCVINLILDKVKAFLEVFRVLKPGGKFIISDVVLLKELPDFIRDSIEAYIGCLSGAIMKDEYIKTIKSAGFRDVEIVKESSFPIECMTNDPTATAIIGNLGIPIEKAKEVASSVISIYVRGVKR